MSWLRATSIQFARSLSRSLDPRRDYSPRACYSAAQQHWRQAHETILASQPSHLHDDVLTVVSHLEQLCTLLVLEARAREIQRANSPAECLELLLSENICDKLYEWAAATGKYENVIRLELLKLYGSLISHYSSQVLSAEPFLRPLLKLLSGFRNELPPSNVEVQLVLVLNQTCVALMQNVQLIELFFLTTHASGAPDDHEAQNEFIIVRLLLSSVHREGTSGAAARDALLLCAKMSAMSQQLADYMLASNTCPVLATGLSGLYSLLPRTLEPEVHRLTPDDVNSVHKLTLFIDSLEFCNAVAQVAHPSIKRQLWDLLYQGFLVPVLGPAVLQSAASLQAGAAEQAAATAYLELLIRCSSARGLLRPVLRFLLRQEYDGVRVVDVLLGRLDGDSQLSLVTLSLMETLIDLNCEDVMLELIFKYLLNGHHLMIPHRNKISHPDPYREAAVAFLSLAPQCCSRSLNKTRECVEDLSLHGRRVLEFGRDDERRLVNGGNEMAMGNLVPAVKINYGNPHETLFYNYHAYLCDARFEIASRSIACANWTSRYDSVTHPKRETNNNSAREIDIPPTSAKEQDSLISVCTSGYETLKTSDTSEKEPHSLTSLIEDMVLENSQNMDPMKPINEILTDLKEHDSLTSIGESSGYESFRWKFEEADEDGSAEESFWKSIAKEVGTRTYDAEVPLVRSWRASAESIIGPLLCSLLKKSAALLEADVTHNFLVTGAISRLVALPSPLVTSLLLCPGFVMQPNVPSLFQILSKLKQEVDLLSGAVDDVGSLVDHARVFLVRREVTHAAGRGSVQQSPTSRSEHSGDSKRRSLSNSFSSMFARRLSASSPSSQHSHQVSSPSYSHQVSSPSYSASPQKRPNFTDESYWSQSITLRSILNAVILDEWIKELAALAEEHALRLSAENYEDDAYIRSVAL